MLLQHLFVLVYANSTFTTAKSNTVSTVNEHEQTVNNCISINNMKVKKCC